MASFWTGHSSRHFLHSVAAALEVPQERRDFLSRWGIDQHQSNDYVLASRQVVLDLQELILTKISEGSPGYDESELLESLMIHLQKAGVNQEPADREVMLHRVMLKTAGGHSPLQVWPLVNPTPEETPLPVAEPVTSAPPSRDQAKEGVAPYFISISRKTNFRRIHKRASWGGAICGVLPWKCNQTQDLWELRSAEADAICKDCLKAMEKAIASKGSKDKPLPKGTDMETESSGSSSSSDPGFSEPAPAPFEASPADPILEPVWIETLTAAEMAVSAIRVSS